MAMTPAFAQDLEFRRVDQLFRQNATAPILLFIFSTVSLLIGWNKVPHAYALTWAITWQLTGYFRGWMTWKWNRAKSTGSVRTMKELHRWSWVIISGCILSGVAAGLLGVGSRLYLGQDEQLYLGILIVGMCSSSMSAYALSLASGLGFLLPAMAIWGIGLAYTGAPWQMLLFVVVYMIVHIRLAKNWNNYAVDSLRLNLDLHQNQERLRLAMDSSGASSWSWEPESDLFTCDANMVKVVGSPSSSFHCLQDFLERVHPDDRNYVRRAMFDALQVGELDIEHRLSLIDDHPHFVALRGKSQGGTFKHLSGIIWDITNKKNQELVRFERDLLQRSNHAKLMFLANVSHEIRTPLTAINGFTENILSEQDLPRRFHERLNIILRNGKYLTSVIHDLLDLSKAEADNIFIQQSKVNLPQEIDDSIHVLQSAIRKKNLLLRVIYDSPVPEVITADATRLRQILINLLSNSTKYTERGQIEIRVSFDASEASGSLRIVVADTGIGITKSDARNLFQAFTRGNSEQVRKRQGSGLGLILSRTLALKMGGDLRLLSTMPQTETCDGSTAFELTIEVGPCHGVNRLVEHPWTRFPFRPLPEKGVGFENRRFLLVEDDEDIRYLLENYLEKKGANVIPCCHGGEALANAFDSHFDAVLMDIKMPVMDGCQATSLLRQRGFRQPIIALTAHANSSDMLMCYEAGCDFYLSKPIDFGHLDNVLSRCLDVPVVTTS